jgi:hypothetical protein
VDAENVGGLTGKILGRATHNASKEWSGTKADFEKKAAGIYLHPEILPFPRISAIASVRLANDYTAAEGGYQRLSVCEVQGSQVGLCTV